MTKENNPSKLSANTVKKDKRDYLQPNVFSSTNQPSPEAKSKGKQRYEDLKRIKHDMFEQLKKDNGIDLSIEEIMKKAKAGEGKEFLDLLRIITPKDIDVTTKGESIKVDITKDMVQEKIKELSNG